MKLTEHIDTDQKYFGWNGTSYTDQLIPQGHLALSGVTGPNVPVEDANKAVGIVFPKGCTGPGIPYDSYFPGCYIPFKVDHQPLNTSKIFPELSEIIEHGITLNKIPDILEHLLIPDFDEVEDSGDRAFVHMFIED